MENQLTINFNNQNYIATYNPQSGYYELELQAPEQGGIYTSDINFTDLYGQEYEDSVAIQIWAKEKIKIETNKMFMWIFDFKDFTVKDIVEISNYEINIDEERDLAIQYDVMSIPTFIVFKGGKEVGRSVGVQDKEEIKGMLK